MITYSIINHANQYYCGIIKANGSKNHCPNIHINQNIKTSIRLNSSLLSNTLIIKLKIYKEKHVPKHMYKKFKITIALCKQRIGYNK